jgi:hypothetical protein
MDELVIRCQVRSLCQAHVLGYWKLHYDDANDMQRQDWKCNLQCYMSCWPVERERERERERELFDLSWKELHNTLCYRVAFQRTQLAASFPNYVFGIMLHSNWLRSYGCWHGFCRTSWHLFVSQSSKMFSVAWVSQSRARSRSVTTHISNYLSACCGLQNLAYD